MFFEGRVLQSTDVAVPDGSSNLVRLGRAQEVLVADARARFYDAVKRGNVFMAVNTAAGALTTVAASATGLILFNPANSGVNLVLLRLCVALQSLPAGAAGLVLAGGPQAALPATAWTALTGTGNVNGVLPAFIGGGKRPMAMAASAANAIPTIIQRWIGGGAAATVAASTTWTPQIVDQIDGEIILAPGSIIALESVTTAITVGASLTWEEVPIG